MSVNNETGAIYDVKNAFDIVKRINPATVTHTDAVQAFLKTNVNFRALKADLITVSGHKINAPKGVGALIVSGDIIKTKKLVPTLLGGGQEGNFRSGTENVLGISALGAAAQYNKEKLPSFIEKTNALSELLISLLPDSVRVNRPEAHAPHIVSITLPAIKSETALHFLSGKGIYVSSGSACASNGRHKSHVLVAYGLSDLDTDCTLRISLSDKVSEDDIRYTAEMIGEAVRTLVKIG
jgi:cysteine desulfurase